MTDNRFAIVPIPPGTPPADALVVGPMDTVMQLLPDTLARNDSIRELQAARLDAAHITAMQKASRTIQATSLCDSIDTMIRRLDALETRRLENARRKAKADAEEEAQRVQEYLDGLPDPDEPNDPAIYPPSGHLHEVSAPNTDNDNEGDLPEVLTRVTPVPPGNYPLDDPAELDDPPYQKQRNPVAVSLNEADDY